MFSLQPESKPVYHLHYAGPEMQELEALVEKTYGREFEFLLERANDTVEHYDVEPVDITGDTVSKYDREAFMAWVEGRGDETYLMGDLLNDLCFRGLIPAGEYFYNVSW